MAKDNSDEASNLSDSLDWRPICRECGCTDDRACEGGCAWLCEDLCTACAVRDPSVLRSGEVLEAAVTMVATGLIRDMDMRWGTRPGVPELERVGAVDLAKWRAATKWLVLTFCGHVRYSKDCGHTWEVLDALEAITGKPHTLREAARAIEGPPWGRAR